MQTWLGEDDANEKAIAYQSSYVHGAEGDGEPDV
jgi:hypothetical protein